MKSRIQRKQKKGRHKSKELELPEKNAKKVLKNLTLEEIEFLLSFAKF